MYPLIIILLITTVPSHAQSTPCTSYKFANGGYSKCVNLPVFKSALHYTYQPPTRTLEIAYRHPDTTSKWVAWAINPTGKGMIGAQTLVAHRNPKDGSLVAYTSPITSYDTHLQKGLLSFNVTRLKAENINNEIIIFATINNVTHNGNVVNLVWQEGPLSKDGVVQKHVLTGSNLHSMASLNLGSGAINSDYSLKIAHAALNVIGWGILLPLGSLIARHMKVVFPGSDPAWFYLHAGCQLSGYVLGVTGWATGLKLTSGKHEHHQFHRWLGIIIFCMATLQVVLALFFRPKIGTACRVTWTKTHHTIGHLTIFLGMFNLLQGYRILKPGIIWQLAYLIVLLAFLVADVTPYVASKRKETQVGDSNN